jgi:hypothetical protein
VANVESENQKNKHTIGMHCACYRNIIHLNWVFRESFSNRMLRCKLSEQSSSTFVTCGCHNSTLSV